jgi:hypothetical protein
MCNSLYRPEFRKAAFTALISYLEAMAIRAEHARTDAQARANEHGGKLESRFDTFKEEAQYLAYGQGRRREEILGGIDSCRTLLQQLDQLDGLDCFVRPGRIVRLVGENGRKRAIMIAPAGAGFRLTVGLEEIVVVSQNASVGKILMGKEMGDEITLPANERNEEEWLIAEVI